MLLSQFRKELTNETRKPKTILHKFVISFFLIQKISFNLGWISNHLMFRKEMSVNENWNMIFFYVCFDVLSALL